MKFVGCDADFAYARDLVRDVTIKMPHAALIADLAERYKDAQDVLTGLTAALTEDPMEALQKSE